MVHALRVGYHAVSVFFLHLLLLLGDMSQILKKHSVKPRVAKNLKLHYLLGCGFVFEDWMCVLHFEMGVVRIEMGVVTMKH